MSNRKEELEKSIKKQTAELSKINDAEEREEMLPFVGRYFKYRNNYSCPQKPSDYWWMYFRVDKIHPTGAELSCTQFEVDMYGKIFIRPNEKIYKSILFGSREIKKSEYEKAWASIMAKINKVA